ncbi:hypothetical protein FJQ98_16160 [Lysinibacillus agricola]|uniref:Uncharacterized protein n=1 Tax=Lysinibacillus agricola TaxID=2590012 RepID=A0ABX7ALW9_9BACI|nr:MULTISPECIES: hypothetical protein [Lysinibacillus]KOS61523.1 hypothetical protein AN161_18210 [Lysinibacillus sp. FJAT-14222]QQP10780.1 hypothetical protein FJQ98_16160 [Lysinibacillus agricola]
MSNGVRFGLQYLEEGEYTLNGGLGNKILSEFEVKNGQLFFNGEKEPTVPPTMYEFLKSKSSNVK